MRSGRVARLSAALCLTVLSSPLFCQSVIAEIPVGKQPFMVAANPKTNRIYVGNQGDDTISVIDGSSNQVIDTVKLNAAPYGIGVNPVANRIYVVAGHYVEVIDGNSDAVLRGIRVGAGANRLAINLWTNRIYVTNENDGTVSVIDALRNRVMATVKLNGNPIGIAVNSRTNLVYVPLYFCSSCGLVVINGSTNRVVTTIPLPGTQLDDVTVRPLGNLVYVTDESKGLFVVDGKTNSVLGNVAGLSAPETVAVLPGTPLVVESDTGSNKAVFLNEDSISISREVAVGMSPSGTAVSWPLRHVYITNTLSDSVSVIEY